MRRRRGGGAAPAEACGVWLDTAELKRGPARPLGAKLKAPTRIPERKQSPVLLPQPGHRQTTIPAFFSPHTDESNKENSRPTPRTPKKDCGDSNKDCGDSNKDCGGSGVPLAARPVKILALPQPGGAQEEPPGAEQGVQGTSRAWTSPLEPLELQGEAQGQSRASRGAGGDPWCCSQGSEHSGILTPRNKPRIFPGETASGSRKPQPWGRADSGAGCAGAGNTNPGPGAAPRGVCCSPQSPVRAQPLGEKGQSPGGSCRQLLWQGNRVTADRDRDRDRDCSLRELELGPERLFTQDSQGNRVIKHW